jgi:hypothetical protein
VTRWALLALLLLTAVRYRSVTTADFVYEDSNAVFSNPAVTGAAPIALDRARWLSALSHRLVFLVSDEPRASHLVNLALHLANGALVYALALGFVAPWAAVCASGVFLLHPLQTETVAYVASRSELLATSFGLLACWIALEARRWWAHVAIWACVALAVCAKESIAVVVPLMALADVVRGRRLSWLRVGCLLLPIAAVAASIFRFDYLTQAEMGAWAYAATQATALWRYLALVVVPVGQSIDHDFDVVAWGWRWAALAGLFVLATFPILASASMVNGDTHARGRLWDESPTVRAAAFGVTWLLVALGPRFLMRIPEALNEHQMYLPMVGVSLALGAVAASWTAREGAHEYDPAR